MSVLTNIRETAVRIFGRPYGYARAYWERLAPRERRWVTILLVLIPVAVFVLVAWLAFSNISDLEEGNASIRDALAAIAKNRDAYLEAKARNSIQEARIGTEPPQLTGDLEAAAQAEKVKIDESSERPTVPAGRRYVEHDVDLKVREVDLQSLTRFLHRIETGPRLIFFTRLSLKHRYGETDKLDAELTATAFEKVREDKQKKKPEGAAPGGGGKE
jgi:general secretion pathway protein M